jgi:hypothetical protein
MTNMNAMRQYNIIDFFGLYSGSMTARIIQRANITSTIILHAKALVVMKGKKREPETKKGIKGTKKSPAKMTFLRICLFINSILSWTQHGENKEKSLHYRHNRPGRLISG